MTDSVRNDQLLGGLWMRDAEEARTVRLSIPAQPEFITLSRLALAGLSRVRALPAETLADLKLAITEACSNSVRHAYAGGDGTVEIVYRLEPDRIEIEVSDDGTGFDHSGAGALREDDRAQRGRARHRDHPLDRRRPRDRDRRGRPRVAAAVRQEPRAVAKRRGSIRPGVADAAPPDRRLESRAPSGTRWTPAGSVSRAGAAAGS